jgi:hypothetical protein
MARSSRPSNASHNTTALHAAQRAIFNSEKHRSSVNKLHATSKMIADFLSPNGRIDKALEPNADEDAMQFIEECKRRLVDVAEGNAKRMKEIDVFVEAVTSVKNDLERSHNSNSEQEEEAVDYEAAIHSAMERIRHTNNNQDVQSHPMVIEVKTAMGQKVQQQDDELEILQTFEQDANAYKCPITGMLFEQPVKNKVCGHTYSTLGLQQLLKNKKKSCPIPGCTMNYLGMNMIEEDEEMKMKVKRFMKREEMKRKKRVMEEDMGEDELGEGGVTLID